MHHIAPLLARSVPGLAIAGLVLATASLTAAEPGQGWVHLSSKTGDLPAPPGGSTQQTGAVVADFDGDGNGNFRKTELVVGQGWHEARLRDLDGDGDLDLLNKPYNWETPRVDVWLNHGTRPGARGIGTSASFYGPVGMQLWSLRQIFKENV